MGTGNGKPVFNAKGGSLLVSHSKAKMTPNGYLNDIRNYCNMFYKKLKTQGQPYSGYAQLGLTNLEQLALAIFKTLPKQ